MSELIKRVEEEILVAIPNAQIMVRDPQNDGAHFEAIVISELFVDMPLAKQHRLVMKALEDLFADQLHALALKTYTPEKWSRVQG